MKVKGQLNRCSNRRGRKRKIKKEERGDGNMFGIDTWRKGKWRKGKRLDIPIFILFIFALHFLGAINLVDLLKQMDSHLNIEIAIALALVFYFYLAYGWMRQGKDDASIGCVAIAGVMGKLILGWWAFIVSILYLVFLFFLGKKSLGG